MKKQIFCLKTNIWCDIFKMPPNHDFSRKIIFFLFLNKLCTCVKWFNKIFFVSKQYSSRNNTKKFLHFFWIWHGLEISNLILPMLMTLKAEKYIFPGFHPLKNDVSLINYVCWIDMEHNFQIWRHSNFGVIIS